MILNITLLLILGLILFSFLVTAAGDEKINPISLFIIFSVMVMDIWQIIRLLGE